MANSDGVVFTGGEIAKSPFKKIVVAVRDYRGARFIDIREMELWGNGEWKFTHRGVTVPIAQVRDMAVAIVQVGKFVAG